MIFCWLLWLTARGAATGDGYDISVFTHLSGLDANSSCSIVSLNRTDDCYSLAACTDHKESGDYWCHTEVANDTELDSSTSGDKNLVCADQVMFVTSPYESWLYRIHPSNFTFLKVRPFKRDKFNAFAFSTARQRLYFSTNRRRNYKIGSRDFDDANQIIHVKRIYCFGLAVDDINSIVFFIGLVKPLKMISRLKNVGYEIVKRMHWNQVSIAVHPGSKTLYTGDYRRITSVDYSGNHFKILVEDNPIHSIAVTPSGDMLHYGTDRGIHSFDLKTLVRFNMPIDLPKGCNSFRKSVYAYNRVIMSCMENAHIIIYDPKTKVFQMTKINNAHTIPFFIVKDCY